jgi:16S rRNA (uracil1498-N3)-methyltransferase
MSAPRFQVDGLLAAGAEIDLPERAARHVAVLRLRAGDVVVLFSGRGGEHAARLTLVSRSGVRAKVGAFQDVGRESPLAITLAQCISAGDRMDLTLQKATELGVQKIVPLISERAVVRLKEERAERRLQHWRAVVAAACEQCGRNSIPEVSAPTELHAWLAAPETRAAEAARLVLAPEAASGLGVIPRSDSTLLLIGPEGGLADHELVAAKTAGFTPIRLGPRILRTETAPLAAITALQVLWGDLN